MPGIFGIISKRPKEINCEELNVMIKSLRMEHFYNSGEFVLADMAVYVGWTCHKGSFSDCLPIINEKKNKILIYFGENFHDLDELDELKKRNHTFERKNATYIIHMYEEWGEEFLLKLNGWFHGILIDIAKKKIILFNDRYGMQRMYYTETRDAFYFSAEAKAILRVQPQSRQVELMSLAELFTHNCVLDHRSLFKELYMLPGGACWTFDENKKVKKRTYFEPVILENQPLLEKEFHYERLKNTFHNILKRYFRSEDQIGMFLSGSLDCRIMLANAQYGPGKLSCYALSNVYGIPDNISVTRRLAEIIGQSLRTLTIDDKYFSQYHELLERTIYVSDGGCDPSGTIELYLNQMAREIAPVRMLHSFGGTFLRGEEILHLTNLDNSLFNYEFQNAIRTALERYKELSSSSLTHKLHNGLAWSAYGKLSIQQSQLTIRAPFTDNDFVKLLYRSSNEVTSNDKLSRRLIEDGNPLFGKKGEIDRAMKRSHPLLKWGRINRIRETVKHHLLLEQERVFLSGKKDSHNFRVWYRDELSEYLKDILLDERSTNRFYIDKTSLEHIVTSHTKGIKNYTHEINKILMAEIVHRLFIDN